MDDKRPTSFEQAASSTGNIGFFAELWGFMRANKKWWLMPIIAVIIVFSLLIFLSGTGVAPIIYTLF